MYNRRSNRKEIIDILPSSHQYYFEEYLSKILKEERMMVKIVNIDMWDAYKKVTIKEYCIKKIKRKRWLMPQ